MTQTYLRGYANKSPGESTALQLAWMVRKAQLRAAGLDVVIAGKSNGYGKRTYEGTAPASLTDEEIAWLCDDPVFGGVVTRGAEGAFTCQIYTD